MGNWRSAWPASSTRSARSTRASLRTARRAETDNPLINIFLYKLIPPRPSFPTDMTEAESAVMVEHFGYWQGLLEKGVAVVYGPVQDPAGAWGLAVVEADGEEDVRSIGAEDPAVRSGVATFDVFGMPDAIVRPRG